MCEEYLSKPNLLLDSDHMTVARQILVAAALAVSPGCYKYTPSTIDATPEGAKVQALLSTEGQIALRERLRVDLRTVEGEFLELRGDTVLLAVQTATVRDDFGNANLYQRVDIPRSYILRIDQRQFDTPRTVGLIAVVAGAAVLVISQAFGEGNPGQLPPPDGGPDDRRAIWSLLRIPLSIF